MFGFVCFWQFVFCGVGVTAQVYLGEEGDLGWIFGVDSDAVRDSVVVVADVAVVAVGSFDGACEGLPVDFEAPF